MNYKIEGAIKKNRKNFIIFIILWIFIAIVLVSPIAFSIILAIIYLVYSFFKANGAGTTNGIQVFLETFVSSITNPFGTIGNIFSEGAVDSYITTLLIVTVFYAVFFFIGFVRSAPKNEFTDIEHGSSDWSQRGEQYTILSKNKGLILAEDNYLPLDKRGNINVLVVGRFRFW